MDFLQWLKWGGIECICVCGCSSHLRGQTGALKQSGAVTAASWCVTSPGTRFITCDTEKLAETSQRTCCCIESPWHFIGLPLQALSARGISTSVSLHLTLRCQKSSSMLLKLEWRIFQNKSRTWPVKLWILAELLCAFESFTTSLVYLHIYIYSCYF